MRVLTLHMYGCDVGVLEHWACHSSTTVDLIQSYGIIKLFFFAIPLMGHRFKIYNRRGVRYSTGMFGAGMDVVPKPVLMLYRTYRSVRYLYERLYRYRRYRYQYLTELTEGCHAEVTEVSGTGVDVISTLRKCPVPVLTSYRTYRSVRYRYWYRTDTGLATGADLGTCTGGMCTEYPPISRRYPLSWFLHAVQ